MNIAVVFGGKSCEHNVSVVTGLDAFKNVGKNHTAMPVYIHTDGVFYTGKEFAQFNTYKKDNLKKAVKKAKRVCFMPSNDFLYSAKGKKLMQIDVCLLCCHGVNGEDGSLQGMLQLSGIAYTGPNVLSAAASMDKITMKKLFKSSKLNQVPYVQVLKSDYLSDENASLKDIEKKLEYPVIVKPSNLGSSIGINKANNNAELKSALCTAFEFDTRVVVEKALTDFIELNCAVVKKNNTLIASEIEQPVLWTDFLTYDDKYLRKYGKNNGGEGRKFPADISNELSIKIKTAAKKAYESVSAGGVARIDFMYAKEILYINEINTIPGSLANYLFDFSYTQLIDILCESAVKENEIKNSLNYTYKSTYDINANK